MVPGSDEENNGSMISTEFDQDVFGQASRLVRAAFGHEAYQRVTPDENTTDITVPNVQCVYVLDDGSWREKHGRFQAKMSVSYRIPGTHPDEDIWEPENTEQFVKVTHDHDGIWFVADLVDAYLLVPAVTYIYRLVSVGLVHIISQMPSPVGIAELSNFRTLKRRLALLQTQSATMSVPRLPIKLFRSCTPPATWRGATPCTAAGCGAR